MNSSFARKGGLIAGGTSEIDCANGVPFAEQDPFFEELIGSLTLRALCHVADPNAKGN